MIQLIDLSAGPNPAPYLSYELLDHMKRVLSQGKKILCIYNKRGSSHSLVCRGCGFFPTCPHCDIHLSHHTTPTHRMLCHQCNFISEIPVSCPRCGTHTFDPIGVGIHRVEADLIRLFSTHRVFRVDSDTKRDRKKKFLDDLDSSDIIIGTQMALSTIDGLVGMVAFLLVDQDLSIPEYDREEQIYAQVTYARKQGIPVFLQTYHTDHEFLQLLLSANTREFLQYTLAERRSFRYPPYGELIYIWVSHASQDRVRDMIHKLSNKIEIWISELAEGVEKPFFSYDRDIWQKYAGTWRQKLVLKGAHLDLLLDHISVEITKNHGIQVERK